MKYAMLILVFAIFITVSSLSFISLNGKLDSLNSRLDSVNSKFDSVSSKVYSVAEAVYSLESSRQIQNLSEKLKALELQQQREKNRLSEISRGMVMRATAYDLTVASCGKRKSHPEYGITRSGNKAVAGRTVAVDPRIIPLGSKLSIKFPEKYAYLDGYYIAEDTGSAVKGNIVDVYLGENEPAVDVFGTQKIKVYILRRGWKG